MLRWVAGIGLATVAAGVGGVSYAFAVEPDWLAVERVTVGVPDLSPALAGLRIAHLSDLHWGPYTGQKEIRAAVERANALSPDLIVLTGDYVLWSADYAVPCARELAALQAPLGVFAVPGNHDYWTDIEVVTAQLRAAGVTMLRNSAYWLGVGGVPLWLVGIDDVTEQHHDLEAALVDVPSGEPILLMVHEPDLADDVARLPHQVLLQLSGHSHGGQVNLPPLGPLVLPSLARKYPAGLQTVPGSALWVYTSRGVGLIPPPVRFNCRPEIALLTLSRA
jgi:predicted MPP superfamily phosphohydrolase